MNHFRNQSVLHLKRGNFKDLGDLNEYIIKCSSASGVSLGAPVAMHQQATCYFSTFVNKLFQKCNC